MSIVDQIKQEYMRNSIVMSELLRNYTDQLSVEEIRDLLWWSGDDEFMTVTEDKEIITKEKANERT